VYSKSQIKPPYLTLVLNVYDSQLVTWPYSKCRPPAWTQTSAPCLIAIPRRSQIPVTIPIGEFFSSIAEYTSDFKWPTKKNSMVWVRERTIPTERPPLLAEVIANFSGWRVPRGQRDGSLRPYSRFSRQEPLLFYQVDPQMYSRGWVNPVRDPLLFFLVVPGIEPGPPDL
jgi:hypothetical protein